MEKTIKKYIEFFPQFKGLGEMALKGDLTALQDFVNNVANLSCPVRDDSAPPPPAERAGSVVERAEHVNG